MIKKRITDPADPLFAPFWSVYRTAFPSYEQREAERQAAILADPAYHLEVFLEDPATLAGFIAWWEHPSFTYLEHAAICEHLRGQGAGSSMLRSFLEENEKMIILEIDPLIDESSRRRLKFYTSLGAQANDFGHIHPGYKPGDEPHSLLVLSYGRKITLPEFLEFRSLVLEKL